MCSEVFGLIIKILTCAMEEPAIVVPFWQKAQKIGAGDPEMRGSSRQVVGLQWP